MNHYNCTELISNTLRTSDEAQLLTETSLAHDALSSLTPLSQICNVGYFTVLLSLIFSFQVEHGQVKEEKMHYEWIDISK